jgi:hypothetical protein
MMVTVTLLTCARTLSNIDHGARKAATRLCCLPSMWRSRCNSSPTYRSNTAHGVIPAVIETTGRFDRVSFKVLEPRNTSAVAGRAHQNRRTTDGRDGLRVFYAATTASIPTFDHGLGGWVAPVHSFDRTQRPGCASSFGSFVDRASVTTRNGPPPSCCHRPRSFTETFFFF